jgi:hypothetical protein
MSRPVDVLAVMQAAVDAHPDMLNAIDAVEALIASGKWSEKYTYPVREEVELMRVAFARVGGGK